MDYEYIVNCLYDESRFHYCRGCHFNYSDVDDVLYLMYYKYYSFWEAINEVLSWIDEDVYYEDLYYYGYEYI